MNKRRLISLLLCFTLLLSTVFLFGCNQNGGPGDESTVKVSWWLATGEDSTYYDSYDDNPAVKYLETMEFNGSKIDLSFMVPLSGSELDNFNTLLATDEFAGLMDMAYSNTSQNEMYNDGIIHDLTPYIEEYMPNYMSFIENNPELAGYMYTFVDGEKKNLSLYAVGEEVLGNFMGHLYRRDWIAKYGTNPETGEPFTYGLTDPNDKESWTDDVVFPSGGADPVYISDWEWMFEIFEKAFADLGIEDGYCTSIIFKGYNQAGGLNSSFGGGNPMWMKDADGNAAFGGDNDSLKAYLECMNAWYDKGWLDKAFAERSNDAPYAIDIAGTHLGTVGMWVGRRSETGSQLDVGDNPYTAGSMVYGARFPINDIYGTAAEQMVEPNSLYQESRIRGSLVVTNKIAEEDLPTVLTFLDYLYTTEGGALICFGLTKEQFEETQDETYLEFGVTNGAFSVEEQADGSIIYARDEQLLSDNNLASAMAGKRLKIGYYADGFVPALNASYLLTAREAMAEWDYYTNEAFPERALRQLFTVEESNTFSKVFANVDAHMASTIPAFITGKLDIGSEDDWNDYTVMLNKYQPEKVTAIYQRLFDLLNQ